ncbi:Cupin domain protein [Planctopirus ephydatiae]|uniref:Cupin domain protein n=1 Tax=Planctopirus ephydatiae TaxID=2528019 RepID=A0A518GNV4_9PLAN|nr:cupin domain-containing protein [Planctopirus ephydatiae]QDV30308.1 Cupin domain protein [Planctopirus ephydatiae]
MAIPHAQPGDVIDVRPLASKLAASITNTLIKTPNVEVIRMVLLAGKALSEHKAPGEIIVQCLEGDITFTTMGAPKRLLAGDMLYLAAGEPHELVAVEDSSFLLTIMRPAASQQS